MELIVISESKLKVMLSEDDMREYELDDMNSAQTREAFRSLMRAARDKCGFNGLEGRVFVQLYRSKAGGCELFVTKLTKGDRGEDSAGWENPHPAECRRRDPRHNDEPGDTVTGRCSKSPGKGRHHVIYRFDEMQNLLSICGVLLASRYSGTGTAYAEQNRNAYYLILDEETYAAGEYYGKLCPSSFYYYINEHCTLICPNAVPTLGQLA